MVEVAKEGFAMGCEWVRFKRGGVFPASASRWVCRGDTEGLS